MQLNTPTSFMNRDHTEMLLRNSETFQEIFLNLTSRTLLMNFGVSYVKYSKEKETKLMKPNSLLRRSRKLSAITTRKKINQV